MVNKDFLLLQVHNRVFISSIIIIIKIITNLIDREARTDSGRPHGYFYTSGGSESIRHAINLLWREGRVPEKNSTAIKQFNSALRGYSLEDLRQMSGNPYINDSVYALNVWYVLPTDARASEGCDSVIFEPLNVSVDEMY